jgi:hypothetical protein
MVVAFVYMYQSYINDKFNNAVCAKCKHKLYKRNEKQYKHKGKSKRKNRKKKVRFDGNVKVKEISQDEFDSNGTMDYDELLEDINNNIDIGGIELDLESSDVSSIGDTLDI